MVYDLFKNVLDGLQVNVERVVIDTFKDDTFMPTFLCMSITPKWLRCPAQRCDRPGIKGTGANYVMDEVLENAEAWG